MAIRIGIYYYFEYDYKLLLIKWSPLNIKVMNMQVLVAVDKARGGLGTMMASHPCNRYPDQDSLIL